MSFISYAQNYEDVMLWRALKHVENGFYIDVGANDPHIDSVTKAFYERGWHGINVEPLSQHHHDLMITRPNDTNLLCAAGSENGQIEIWECDVRGWATASTVVVSAHKRDGHDGVFHTVPMAPLRDICAQYVVGEIHFLKVDVEGFEKQVIQGMDLKKYRPWILVIEATKPNSTDEIHQEWEPILISNDYILAYADGLNRFYVSQEKASNLLQALQYPPNVFDGYIRGQQLDSELRAQQAQSATQQALEDAKASQTEAEQLHQQLDHAHTQKQQTQEQLQQALILAQSAQTRADQLYQQLNEQATQALSQLQLVQIQLQQALQLAQTSQENMQHAVAKAEQAETLANGLLQEKQISAAELMAVQLELQHIHQANHNHWLQLEQTRQELHGVHQSNHHHWQLAEQWQKQIKAIHYSWSWRLTWPVRLAGGLSMHPLATIKTLANQTLAWCLNTFEKPLTKAMAWVLARPQLTNLINGWLMRWPHLHAHLLGMAHQNGVLYPALNHHAPDNQCQNDSGVVTQTLAQLSPRARQIYADLKTAIDQQHKGGL